MVNTALIYLWWTLGRPSLHCPLWYQKMNRSRWICSSRSTSHGLDIVLTYPVYHDTLNYTNIPSKKQLQLLCENVRLVDDSLISFNTFQPWHVAQPSLYVSFGISSILCALASKQGVDWWDLLTNHWVLWLCLSSSWDWYCRSSLC